MNAVAQVRPRVLVVDDEEDVRWMLTTLFQREGYTTMTAPDGQVALEMMCHDLMDLVVVDLVLPKMDGLRLLAEARRVAPLVPIIMITAHGSVGTAVEAMKGGAYDFLTKPVDHQQLRDLAGSALRERQQRQRRVGPNHSLERDSRIFSRMGTSPEIMHVINDVQLVAPTEFTVLISGETGTGKDVVATAIHRFSGRHDGPFVAVDCGAIPASLIEGELFGHEKGAYTGADEARPGKFEAACGGTLFLDEVTNLPLKVQPTLLRALQDRRICRVGSTSPREVDVRIVAATNQDPLALVAAGKLRQDLYYRLNEFPVAVPPLRERTEDILFLAKYFLDLAKNELGKDIQGFANEVADLLQRYSWPGNVRELRAMMRRAALRCTDWVGPEHLEIAQEALLDVPDRALAPAALVPAGQAATLALAGEAGGVLPLKEAVDRCAAEVEKELIQRALEQADGNKAEAARRLQVDYKTLQSKLRKHNLGSRNRHGRLPDSAPAGKDHHE